MFSIGTTIATIIYVIFVLLMVNFFAVPFIVMLSFFGGLAIWLGFVWVLSPAINVQIEDWLE